jgi:hypothetical protein
MIQPVKSEVMKSINNKIEVKCVPTIERNSYIEKDPLE